MSFLKKVWYRLHRREILVAIFLSQKYIFSSPSRLQISHCDETWRHRRERTERICSVPLVFITWKNDLTKHSLGFFSSVERVLYYELPRRVAAAVSVSIVEKNGWARRVSEVFCSRRRASERSRWGRERLSQKSSQKQQFGWKKWFFFFAVVTIQWTFPAVPCCWRKVALRSLARQASHWVWEQHLTAAGLAYRHLCNVVKFHRFLSYRSLFPSSLSTMTVAGFLGKVSNSRKDFVSSFSPPPKKRSLSSPRRPDESYKSLSRFIRRAFWERTKLFSFFIRYLFWVPSPLLLLECFEIFHSNWLNNFEIFSCQ